MQGLPSEERVGTPGLVSTPAKPREVCVTVTIREEGGGKVFNKWHKDYIGKDEDGRFRAEVGVAISEALEHA